MATTQTTPDLTSPPTTGTPLLVSLVPLDHDSFEQMLDNLAAAFPGQSLLVATPDVSPDAASGLSRPSLQIASYNYSAQSQGGWTLTAADFFNDRELAVRHHAQAILQLGASAQSLDPRALAALAEPVLSGQADLAMPCYELPANAGLVNSAILYPLTRALFAAHARFPLALDLCLSARAAERLGTAAQRATAANQPEALLWPAIECAVAGFTITEVNAGPRALPQPPTQDLNAILAQIVSSLFTEIELRAAFWQRSRIAAPATSIAPRPDPPSMPDVQPMLDAFRLAYSNLHEIWSLVLPPHSLVGLKRLSVTPAESFIMPDSLWARIVYDFLLAFRLRTINRGHLLGALTPLYLAWVASHVVQINSGRNAEQHVEAVAAAFEADKPYLVSRWRWPDRFNP